MNFQDKIKDRLQNGFKNWNGGYDAWLEWCNTLYEPDAHYNVYGQRWTLQQYEGAMKKLFEVYDMELGEFYNMLVVDDWCAIRYKVHITNKKTGEKMEQMTMEFVHFKDNPDPIGARVIEGWALSDTPIN
ncbi:MAG TPA: nuclear transport factor 2 family protein [Caproiciproducens sp.]|nr:nuclear transport factor 2 family protein [Caproiciproducens sp.]